MADHQQLPAENLATVLEFRPRRANLELTVETTVSIPDGFAVRLGQVCEDEPRTVLILAFGEQRYRIAFDLDDALAIADALTKSVDEARRSGDIVVISPPMN